MANLIQQVIERLFGKTLVRPRQIVRKDICCMCGNESNCTVVAPENVVVESEADRALLGEQYVVCDGNPRTNGTCLNTLIKSNPHIKFDWVVEEDGVGVGQR